MRAPVLVVGGGLGGVAAALAAAEAGAEVVLTEAEPWIGGQLTAQAVPADEHPWIERFGCTARYRRLRDGIRARYRAHPALTTAARRHPRLNPGGAAVSNIACEPRAALAVLEGMLAPHLAAGRVQLLRECRPQAAVMEGDRVAAVQFAGEGAEEAGAAVECEWALDATETGELLALTGAEHVTGAEAQEDTGEPHAPAAADPREHQAVTWCFALEHCAGEDHTIAPPPGGAREFTLAAPDPRTNRLAPRTFVPNPGDDPLQAGFDAHDPEGDRDLWRFRRILARDLFAPGTLASDVTLVNWPHNDYAGGPLYGGPAEAAARHREGARTRSLALLHWLQTACPRPDGRTGWPGLTLRPDVMGTADGLALAPYVRESRRIVAEHTVVEQELALASRGERGAVRHHDSVGIGAYRIDLHPSTGGRGYVDLAAWPFEIPLGALVPVRLDNLLPAAKNLGTTHITNGCYRLHPVEWAIGEAAGHLAAYCRRRRTTARAVRADPALLAELQAELDAAGIPRRWPAGVRPL